MFQVLLWEPVRRRCSRWEVPVGVVFGVGLVLALFAAPLEVQAEPASASSPPALVIPYLKDAVDLDGRLLEAVWQQAALVEDYQVFEPVETGQPPGRTQARIFWNEKGLYFGFDCQLPDPAQVRASLAPREDVNQDDQVGIYLDTYDDDRQAFVFYLNALGIQQDARMIEGVGWQQSWDTELNSIGQLSPTGYQLEVQIPFSSLRFPNREEQTWGLILTRKFAAEGIKAGWPRLTREQTNTIAQAASLKGIRGIRAGKAIELRPELLVGVNGNPSGILVSTPLPGLWARYGVSSNLSLDMTLNPDFSQVEADPSQLDLNSRYALYTDEMRPFFLEGIETVQAPHWSLYTRSINAPVAGLKLTGKEGGTAVGLLAAYDLLPLPTVTSTEVGDTPGFSSDALTGPSGQPMQAAVLVGRVTQDLPNASVVGGGLALKTLVDSASGAMGGYNQVASADISWRINDTTSVSGAGAVSQTGDSLARSGDVPPEEPTTADAEATDPLRGGAFNLNFLRQDRLNRLSLTVGYSSTGFRSETAFITRPGNLWFDLFVFHRFEPALKGVVYLRPQLYLNASRDEVAPDQLSAYVSPSLATRFDGQRYWNTLIPCWQEWVLDQAFQVCQPMVSISSERQRILTWSAYWSEGTTVDYDALETVWEAGPGLSVRWRPSTRMQVDLSAKWRVALNEAQFLPLYFLQSLDPKAEVELPRWTQWKYRGVGALMLGRKLGLRGIADLKYTAVGSEWTAQLYSQLLLSWIEHPGTALYLGAGNVVAYGPQAALLQPPEWQVFLKASYNWRL